LDRGVGRLRLFEKAKQSVMLLPPDRWDVATGTDVATGRRNRDVASFPEAVGIQRPAFSS